MLLDLKLQKTVTFKCVHGTCQHAGFLRYARIARMPSTATTRFFLYELMKLGSSKRHRTITMAA